MRQDDGDLLRLRLAKSLPKDRGRIFQDWITVSETRDIELQLCHSLQIDPAMIEVLISDGPSRTSEIHACIRRKEDAAILPQ